MGEKEFLKVKGVVECLEGDEFLTREEVAQWLRIRPGTVFALTKREGVKSHLVGGRRCYRRTDIEQLLERRRTEKK